MRAVAFLLMLSFAGYVSTQYAFQTGKQYTYQVRGRLMTGISKINTQYAGLEVDYKIDLIAVGPSTIILNPHGFKAVEVNAELEGGWRDGELKDEAPVDIKGELREFLESPIELTMRQGVVDSIKVEGNLPTWAVNMKKAQASHFVLDTTGANVVRAGNLNRKTNAVRPEEANQESGFFYETMEDTVHGECETYYTVSQNGPFDTPFPFQQQQQPGQQEQNDQENSAENSSQEGSQEQQNKQQMDNTYNKQYKYGQNQWQKEQNDQSEEQQRQHYFGNQQEQQEYQANNAYQQYAAYKQYAQQADSGSAEDSYETRQGEIPWPHAFDKFCNSNDQVYEILKSVNFTSCKNKPVLSYSTSAQLYGRGGDNSLGSAFERAVITRFLACGKDRKQYTILQIKQEEQVNFGLRLNQKTVAGTVQNVTLISITKAGTLVKLQNPKTIQDLSYTFDPLEQKLQQRGQMVHPYAGSHEDNDSQEPQENNQQSNESQESQEQQQQQQQQNQQQRNKQAKRYPRSVSSQESSEEQNDQNQQQNQQNQQNQYYQTSAEGKGPLPQPSLTEAPLNPYLVSPLRTSGMKKRIQDLMKEIVEDITTDKQSMAEAETLSKITKVAQILRFLSYREVEQLYYLLADKRQTEEDQTSRNVFLDAVAIAGTNPNIKFLCDLIQKKQLTGEHAAQIIMTFPMYVRTPTQQILKEIYQLTDSSAVESDKDQVKTAAVLALSNLLYQACVNSRIRNSRYPVATYGQTCDQKTVQRKYVQYFIENLKKHQQSQEPQADHWEATYLTALGNLGVEDVIPEVQRILDDETESYKKVKAIFALKHLIISRQSQNIPTAQFQPVDRQSQDELTDELIENQVLPILVAVSADKGEHPEVRMAALSLLFFTTDADMTIWQQIAYSTWFAGSQEVHAFIYSTLKSLAALERPNSPLHYKMVQKARAVLSLAKPTNAGYATSRNIFGSQFLEHVQSGFYHHLSYFGSQDSNIPAYMFYKNNVQFGNGAYGSSPMEFEAHGDIEKLVYYIYQQFRKENSVDEAHPEDEQVERLVGIQDREQDENNEASFRFKIRSEMERLFSINEQTIQQLIQKAKGQLLPQLLNGVPINYQKTFHLSEQTMEMPSAMGIPITHRFTMAVHFSARGNLKIVNENGLKDVQLQAELHPVYAWKGHGKLSIKSPYTGKKYEAGVQRHMVVEAPFRALVRKAPQGQIVVAFTPSQITKGNPSGQIDIVTYHQRPYTAIITDECWPTSHKEGGIPKIVRAVETPYKNERTFGQKALGMHFLVKEETDYRSQNEGASGWVKFWKSFHSPTCYFNVGWFGPEQIRHSERTLSLDVSKSETKTLAFVVAGKHERKAEYKELWNDSQSGSSESSEEDSKQSSSHQRDSQEYKNKQQTRGQRRSQENNSNSNEDLAQGEGQVVAIALIGKRIPIKAPQESRGIQKLLQKSNPNTIQYILQASKSHDRLYVRAAAGDAANEAAQALPQTSESLQALRDAVLEPQNAKSQEDGCLELEGEYDAPKHADSRQLVVLRKVLLQEDLSVKVKLETEFGKSCKNMKHQIKLQGKLTRGPKMTEWAQKKSPEAKKCEKDEKQGFTVSPVCLYVADQQAAALNRADLKITYSQDLPVQLRNSTDDLEDFVKAYLYPYMSNDRFHEGTQNREIRVEAQMTPSKEFIDVQITKPNSRLSFRSIRTNGLVKTFFPLTATQSLWKNARDRTMRDDSQPFCSVESNLVSTFDNVTYRFDKDVTSGCYQVLAKDCSRRHPVAVLVKDVTEEKKEVILLLGGQTKIHLAQKNQQQNSRLYGQAKLQVKVNDQRTEAFPYVIRSKDNGELIAQIDLMNEGVVQVYSPQFQVATNGKWVYVQAAQTLRNRTCGICGDFNGERVGEYRGPKNCALSSGSLLVASYSYQSVDAQDKEQCKVQPQAKKQIAHEQSQCQRSAAFYPNQPRMFPNQYQPAQNQYEVQYNSQQQYQAKSSNECIQKITEKIRQVVYEVVNTCLKPFVWNSTKRHAYANKVADFVANKIGEILDNNNTAQAIAKAIVKVACAGLKLIPVAGSIIGLVCKAVSPLLEKAALAAVNPICSSTGCCTPSQISFNAAEIEAQLAYAVADESDVDPSAISYIPKRKMPMPCLEMLQENLAQAISKYAYLLLIKDTEMSETERKRISRQVYQDVRDAVQRSMRPGGNGRLVEAITESLDKINGLQKVRKPLSGFVYKLAPFVVRLFNETGCDLPIPRTNSSNDNNSSEESNEQNNQSGSNETENSQQQSSVLGQRRHHHRRHHHDKRHHHNHHHRSGERNESQ